MGETRADVLRDKGSLCPWNRKSEKRKLFRERAPFLEDSAEHSLQSILREKGSELYYQNRPGLENLL